MALWPTLASAKIVDPDSVLGPYARAERIVETRLQAMPGDGLLDKIEYFVANHPTDAATEYLLNRLRIRELNLMDKTADVMQLCPRLKPDDWERRALCAYVTLGTSSSERLETLSEFFEQSLKLNAGTIVPTRVAVMFLNAAFNASDMGRAREIYEKAAQVTPPEARKSQLDLIWNVANVYTSTLNNPRTQREGMKLYDELEKAYLGDPDSRSTADLIAFNKGQTEVTIFRDYHAALQEFAKISEGSRPWVDAQVYKAWALLQIKQNEKAKQTIDGIDLSRYEDLRRLTSLQCYEAMIRQGLGQPRDLTPCVEVLDANTGPEEVIQITRDMLVAKLPMDIELKVLRSFWQIYETQLTPKIQRIMENNTKAIELTRMRAENLVKSLAVRNYNLLKIIAACLVAGLILLGIMLWHLRSKNRSIERLHKYIQETVLARFLPPLIVEEILQGRSRLESAPKDEWITLMFCDIVGFTALSGQLGGKRTAALLNEFMQTVTEVIHRHQGTIDKFIGDAVMIIFGAPTPLTPEAQAQRAAACALDLLQAMERFEYFKLRIGINQGMATVGLFGSEKRSDFTAIGPTVNLASRIEGKAQGQEILASESVARHLAASHVEDRGLFELRGIDQPVRLYRILGAAPLEKAA